MTYKYATFFKWITLLVDYCLLNIALLLSVLIESSGSFYWMQESADLRVNIWLLNLFWFYCSSMVKLYHEVMVRDALPTIRATISALLIFLIVPVFLSISISSINFSTSFIINAFIPFSVLLMIWRTSFLFFRKSRRKVWIKNRKVVIVGASELGKDLYNHINVNTQLGYKVEGFFDDYEQLEANCNQRKLGKVGECIDYSLANGVSEIFCTLPGHEMEKIKTLMQEADKHLLRFRLVPNLGVGLERNLMLELFGHLPILTLRKEPLDFKANEFLKRVFDIGFSILVILTVLSWLIPVISLVIKLDSKGPVFFKQLRSGKDNKPFYCYKFRSMRINNEADSKQAARGDRRITRVGAFLRKTSLDELPQFFNVLMGEMSVVGPRPHMLKHTQDYSALINNFMVRHFLTPGITGWAQVKGYRGETKETYAMVNRVEADLWYMENWSLFLDIKIIYLTVWQIFRGSGNAF